MIGHETLNGIVWIYKPYGYASSTTTETILIAFYNYINPTGSER